MNDIEHQFNSIITQYKKDLSKQVDSAIDELSIDLQKKLESASPVGSGSVHFRDSWERKTQYKNVRYVGNTKGVPNSNGIPLSNILESKNPFISRTFEMSKEELYRKFIIKLGGKI